MWIKLIINIRWHLRTKKQGWEMEVSSQIQGDGSVRARAFWVSRVENYATWLWRCQWHTQQRGFVINAADLGKRFILKSQGVSWLVDMGSKVVELLERRFNDKYSHRLEVFSPRLFPSNCPSWPAVAFNTCLELY
jgi:hypothetical protein